MSERNREYRATHRERNKEYRATHRERNKEYRATHREAILQQKRKHYAEHREALCEQSRKYRAEHRDAVRQQKREDRARNWQWYLWYDMIRRCYPTCPRAKDYYQRGIQVCPEWQRKDDGFLRFRTYIDSALGPKPEGYSLDRVDNNKGYEPGNIRWASQSTQTLNTRRSEMSRATRQIAVKLQSHGLTQTQIGSLLGIDHSMVSWHLKQVAKSLKVAA
jgi:hypothetical protein